MAKNLTVAEFMSTKITFADINSNLLDIITIMEAKNISCVVICDSAEAIIEDSAESNTNNSQNIALEPLGIITERDIVRFLAKDSNSPFDTVTVKDVMSSTLVSINQDDSLFVAMVLCRSQRVKHLTVLNENDNLVGIITYSDLVDANYMQIERQVELLGEGNIHSDDINAQLLEMTLTDPMLKIGNRRAMEIDLKQTYDLGIRYKRPYSIALIDIDYFKKYNDNYGHQQGDEALITVAKTLEQTTRSGDRLYRYGGEEFLLIMPETDVEAARLAGQRLVKCIEDKQLPHKYSPFNKLTISVGTTSKSANDAQSAQTIQQLIKEADEALYSAKAEGRNRTKIASDLEQPLKNSA